MWLKAKKYVPSHVGIYDTKDFLCRRERYWDGENWHYCHAGLQWVTDVFFGHDKNDKWK